MNDNSHKEVLRILAFENSNGIAFWPPKIQRAERQLQVGRSAAMLFTRGFFDEDAHLASSPMLVSRSTIRSL